MVMFTLIQMVRSTSGKAGNPSFRVPNLSYDLRYIPQRVLCP